MTRRASSPPRPEPRVTYRTAGPPVDRGELVAALARLAVELRAAERRREREGGDRDGDVDQAAAAPREGGK